MLSGMMNLVDRKKKVPTGNSLVQQAQKAAAKTQVEGLGLNPKKGTGRSLSDTLSKMGIQPGMGGASVVTAAPSLARPGVRKSAGGLVTGPARPKGRSLAGVMKDLDRQGTLDPDTRKLVRDSLMVKSSRPGIGGGRFDQWPYQSDKAAERLKVEDSTLLETLEAAKSPEGKARLVADLQRARNERQDASLAAGRQVAAAPLSGLGGRARAEASKEQERVAAALPKMVEQREARLTKETDAWKKDQAKKGNLAVKIWDWADKFEKEQGPRIGAAVGGMVPPLGAARGLLGTGLIPGGREARTFLDSALAGGATTVPRLGADIGVLADPNAPELASRDALTGVLMAVPDLADELIGGGLVTDALKGVAKGTRGLGKKFTREALAKGLESAAERAAGRKAGITGRGSVAPGQVAPVQTATVLEFAPGSAEPIRRNEGITGRGSVAPGEALEAEALKKELFGEDWPEFTERLPEEGIAGQGPVAPGLPKDQMPAERISSRMADESKVEVQRTQPINLDSLRKAWGELPKKQAEIPESVQQKALARAIEEGKKGKKKGAWWNLDINSPKTDPFDDEFDAGAIIEARRRLGVLSEEDFDEAGELLVDRVADTFGRLEQIKGEVGLKSVENVFDDDALKDDLRMIQYDRSSSSEIRPNDYIAWRFNKKAGAYLPDMRRPAPLVTFRRSETPGHLLERLRTITDELGDDTRYLTLKQTNQLRKLSGKSKIEKMRQYYGVDGLRRLIELFDQNDDPTYHHQGWVVTSKEAVRRLEDELKEKIKNGNRQGRDAVEVVAERYGLTQEEVEGILNTPTQRSYGEAVEDPFGDGGGSPEAAGREVEVGSEKSEPIDFVDPFADEEAEILARREAEKRAVEEDPFADEEAEILARREAERNEAGGKTNELKSQVASEFDSDQWRKAEAEYKKAGLDPARMTYAQFETRRKAPLLEELQQKIRDGAYVVVPSQTKATVIPNANPEYVWLDKGGNIRVGWKPNGQVLTDQAFYQMRQMAGLPGVDFEDTTRFHSAWIEKAIREGRLSKEEFEAIHGKKYQGGTRYENMTREPGDQLRDNEIDGVPDDMDELREELVQKKLKESEKEFGTEVAARLYADARRQMKESDGAVSMLEAFDDAIRDKRKSLKDTGGAPVAPKADPEKAKPKGGRSDIEDRWLRTETSYGYRPMDELGVAGPVYHETSLDGAKQVGMRVMAGPRNHPAGIYVAENLDLAKGQSGKGVVLEFDPVQSAGLKPESLQNKTMEAVAGQAAEWKVGLTTQKALVGFRVSTQRQLDSLGKVPSFAKRFDFENPEKVEGGFRVGRKGAAKVESTGQGPVAPKEKAEAGKQEPKVIGTIRQTGTGRYGSEDELIRVTEVFEPEPSTVTGSRWSVPYKGLRKNFEGKDYAFDGRQYFWKKSEAEDFIKSVQGGEFDAKPKYKDFDKAAEAAPEKAAEGKVTATYTTKKGREVEVEVLWTKDSVAMIRWPDGKEFRTKVDGLKGMSGQAPEFEAGMSTGRSAPAGARSTGQGAATPKEAPVAEPKKNLAPEKLRAAADRLEGMANESLSRDRLANTAKRAREAGYAIEAANRDVALAQTMRKIADGVESGEFKALEVVQSKRDVERLRSIASQAKTDAERGLPYSEKQAREGDPFTEEFIPYVGQWWPKVNGRNLNEFAREIGKLRGGAKLRDKIGTYHTLDSGVRLEGIILDEIKEGLAFAKTRLDKKVWGDLAENVAEADARVRLGLGTEEGRQAVFSEWARVVSPVSKIDPVKQAEMNLVGRKIPGFFPTPKAIVDDMIERADIEPGMKVLEPSAGKGNIADALRQAGAEVDAVEPVGDLRTILEAKGHKLVGRDFLEVTDSYDRIVMNPPFENGQDMAHVRHAYDLLKPGGKVVAITSEGPFFRQDKAATEFRAWLESVGGTSEKLPEGSFKSSDVPTGVNTRLVEIEKPVGVEVEGTGQGPVAPKAAEEPRKKTADEYSQEIEQLWSDKRAKAKQIAIQNDGDFYTAWGDDAKRLSEMLGVNLQSGKRNGVETPKAWFPISRLKADEAALNAQGWTFEINGIPRGMSVEGQLKRIQDAGPKWKIEAQEPVALSDLVPKPKAPEKEMSFADMLEPEFELQAQKGEVKRKNRGAPVEPEEDPNWNMRQEGLPGFGDQAGQLNVFEEPLFQKRGLKKAKDAVEGEPITVRVFHGTTDARFSEKYDPAKWFDYVPSDRAYADRINMATLDDDFRSYYGEPGQGFDFEKGSVFFTDNPVVAQTYAVDKWGLGGLPKVLQREVSLKNPKVLDWGGQRWKGTAEAIQAAKDEGFDGVIIKNVVDPYSTLESKLRSKKRLEPSTVVVAFDKSQVTIPDDVLLQGRKPGPKPKGTMKPAGEEAITYVTDRASFKEGLAKQFGYGVLDDGTDVAETVTRIADARAKVQLRLAGKDASPEALDAWYKENFFAVTQKGAYMEDVVTPAQMQQGKGAYLPTADGRAIITAFDAADRTTAIHELGHAFRRKLEPALQTRATRHYLKDGTDWTREAEERFAQDLERYFRDGEAPTKGLVPVFEKIKEWFREVYKKLTGTGLEKALHPRVRGLFDEMFGGDFPLTRPFDPGENFVGKGKSAPGPTFIKELDRTIPLTSAEIDRLNEIRRRFTLAEDKLYGLKEGAANQDEYRSAKEAYDLLKSRLQWELEKFSGDTLEGRRLADEESLRRLELGEDPNFDRVEIEEGDGPAMVGAPGDLGKPLPADLAKRPEVKQVRDADPAAKVVKEGKKQLLRRRVGENNWRGAWAVLVGNAGDILRYGDDAGSIGREMGEQVFRDLERILNVSAGRTVVALDVVLDPVKESYGRLWDLKPKAKAELEDMAYKIHKASVLGKEAPEALNESQKKVWQAWSKVNGYLAQSGVDTGAMVDRFVKGDIGKALMGERIFFYGQDPFDGTLRELVGEVSGWGEDALQVTVRGEQMWLEKYRPFSTKSLVKPEVFWPRRVKPEIMDAIKKGSGPVYDDLVKDIALAMDKKIPYSADIEAQEKALDMLRGKIDSGQVREAEKAIEAVFRGADSAGQAVGYGARIERQRLPFALPDKYYDYSFSTAQQHVQQSIQRVTRAEIWGADGSKLLENLRQMSSPGAYMEVIEDVFGPRMASTPGERALKKAVAAEGTIMTTTLLTGLGTTIKQMAQGAAGTGILGFKPMAQGAVQSIGDLVKVMKQEPNTLASIRRSGAVESDLMEMLSMDQADGWGRKVADVALTVTGVKPVDKALRYWTAAAGKIATTDAVKNLKLAGEDVVRDRNYRFLKNWVRMDDEAILRLAQTRKLSKQDEVMAFHAGARTQIRTRSGDMPTILTSHPASRVLARFQSFNYGQMRILQHGFDEAAKGNAIPLARLLAAYSAAGFIQVELFRNAMALLEDKEPRAVPEELQWRLAYNLAQSGMFGLLGRSAEAYTDPRNLDRASDDEGENYNWNALKKSVNFGAAFTPPSVGLVNDMMRSADKLIEGEDPWVTTQKLARKRIVLLNRLAKRGEPDRQFVETEREKERQRLKGQGWSTEAIRWHLDANLPLPTEPYAPKERVEWDRRYYLLVGQLGYKPSEAREELGPKPPMIGKAKERKETRVRVSDLGPGDVQAMVPSSKRERLDRAKGVFEKWNESMRGKAGVK